MELDEIKKFLNVDYEDDDEFIKLITSAAREYIVASVGKYDETSARCKLLLVTIVTDFYENRCYTINSLNEKLKYTIKSMCMQLRLEFGDTSNELEDDSIEK